MMITLGINIGNSMIEIDENNYLTLENARHRKELVCLPCWNFQQNSDFLKHCVLVIHRVNMYRIRSSDNMVTLCSQKLLLLSWHNVKLLLQKCLIINADAY